MIVLAIMQHITVVPALYKCRCNSRAIFSSLRSDGFGNQKNRTILQWLNINYGSATGFVGRLPIFGHVRRIYNQRKRLHVNTGIFYMNKTNAGTATTVSDICRCAVRQINIKRLWKIHKSNDSAWVKETMMVLRSRRKRF